MSKVLTNGIIIPDNGSRNWGGDLANNWNILDVHVGYMTDVKNKVTTLENSVAENTANIQINTSNISALQTSKQDTIEDLETIRAGASAGATAVQPSVLDNYVDLSSEQTITGAKTFKQNITYTRTNFFHQAVSPCYYLRDTELEKGSLASTHTAYPGLWLDKNGNTLGYVRFVEYATGKQTAEIRVSNLIKNGTLDPAGSEVNCTALLELQPTGEKSLIPERDNDINLGTSTNKWKTLNGVNPGALSLPNCGESVNVTSQVVNNDGIYQYTNNLYDGLLVVTAFADNFQIANQGFEDRVVRSTDNVVTAHIALRLNEKASMRFKNFTNFAYVKLFKLLGNV